MATVPETYEYLIGFVTRSMIYGRAFVTLPRPIASQDDVSALDANLRRMGHDEAIVVAFSLLSGTNGGV